VDTLSPNRALPFRIQPIAATSLFRYRVNSVWDREIGTLYACPAKRIMKTLNPFVPTVTLIDLPQRNRREQFKFGVYAVITIQVLLLLGWLLSNSARPTAPGGYPSEAAPLQPETTKMAAASSESGYAESSASAPSTASLIQPVSTTSQPASASPVAQSTSTEVSYMVKSGDTLSRIARIYGTTVKAIKSANNLDSERLVVGRKLKMPETSA